MTSTTLIINEELKTLLPPLSEAEYAGLEADILDRGCLSALVTWGDILVDGHHRYEICTKHGIPFEVKSTDFECIEDAQLWAGRHQENRRNLTAFHRSELALKIKAVLAAQAKERQIRKPADFVLADLPKQKDTRQEVAKIAGVGGRTLGKAEYIAKHADEETKAKLRSGEAGVSIDGVYNRLKQEEKQDETETESCTPAEQPSTSNENVTPDTTRLVPSKTAGFAPGSEEEAKYTSKTTLNPIPRNRPDMLVRNLFTHFPKEFVPNMIRATFEIYVEMGEKKQAKALASEIYKAYGRK